MKDYNHLKILLIEDNQMFKSLAVRMMPDCKKYTAETAKEGLNLFTALRPDITLLDIGLPDGNGLDVLKQMKKLIPSAFIIMFTQSRVSTDVAEAIKSGASGYITKPFSQKEILQCFERHREHQKEQKQNIQQKHPDSAEKPSEVDKRHG